MVLSIVFGRGLLFLSVVALVVSMWALIDAAIRPTWAWEASGQNKTLWIVLNVVGLFVCGLIIGLIYLLAIRPKVAAAQSRGGGSGAGGYGGGYGGSGATWGAPSGAWPPPPGAPPGSPDGWDRPPPPPPPPSGGIPAGWYPDPGGSGQVRYWTGVAWAEQSPPG